MTKKITTIRFTQNQLKEIDEISKYFELNRSQTVRLAVKALVKLYKQEKEGDI